MIRLPPRVTRTDTSFPTRRSSDLIQFILTDGRTKVANDTRVLIQKVLDDYKAGVVITQVALQRTEPPASVIDAFRDVQAAQADRERAQNEAESGRASCRERVCQYE